MKISEESPTIAGSLGTHGVQRALHDGSFGLYTLRDIVIHVGDQFYIGQIHRALLFFPLDTQSLKDCFERSHHNRTRATFVIGPGNPYPSRDDPSQPINIEVEYGAENAPIERNCVSLDLWEIFDLMRDEFLSRVK